MTTTNNNREYAIRLYYEVREADNSLNCKTSYKVFDNMQDAVNYAIDFIANNPDANIRLTNEHFNGSQISVYGDSSSTNYDLTDADINAVRNVEVNEADVEDYAVTEEAQDVATNSEIRNANTASGNYSETIYTDVRNGRKIFESVTYKNHSIVRIESPRYGLTLDTTFRGNKVFKHNGRRIAAKAVAEVYMNRERADEQYKIFRAYFANIPDNRGCFEVRAHLTYADGQEHKYMFEFNQTKQVEQFKQEVQSLAANNNTPCQIYVKIRPYKSNVTAWVDPHQYGEPGNLEQPRDISVYCNDDTPNIKHRFLVDIYFENTDTRNRITKSSFHANSCDAANFIINFAAKHPNRKILDVKIRDWENIYTSYQLSEADFYALYPFVEEDFSREYAQADEDTVFAAYEAAINGDRAYVLKAQELFTAHADGDTLRSFQLAYAQDRKQYGENISQALRALGDNRSEGYNEKLQSLIDTWVAESDKVLTVNKTIFNQRLIEALIQKFDERREHVNEPATPTVAELETEIANNLRAIDEAYTELEAIEAEVGDEDCLTPQEHIDYLNDFIAECRERVNECRDQIDSIKAEGDFAREYAQAAAATDRIRQIDPDAEILFAADEPAAERFILTTSGNSCANCATAAEAEDLFYQLQADKQYTPVDTEHHVETIWSLDGKWNHVESDKYGADIYRNGLTGEPEFVIRYGGDDKRFVTEEEFFAEMVKRGACTIDEPPTPPTVESDAYIFANNVAEFFVGHDFHFDFAEIVNGRLKHHFADYRYGDRFIETYTDATPSKLLYATEIIPLAYGSCNYVLNDFTTLTRNAFGSLASLEAAERDIESKNPVPTVEPTDDDNTFIATDGTRYVVKGDRVDITADGCQLKINGVTVAQYKTAHAAQVAANEIRYFRETYGGAACLPHKDFDPADFDTMFNDNDLDFSGEGKTIIIDALPADPLTAAQAEYESARAASQAATQAVIDADNALRHAKDLEHQAAKRESAAFFKLDNLKREITDTVDRLNAAAPEGWSVVPDPDNKKFFVKAGGKSVAEIDSLALAKVLPPDKFFARFTPLTDDEPNQRYADQLYQEYLELLDMRDNLSDDPERLKVIDGLIRDLEREMLAARLDLPTSTPTTVC